MKNQNVTLNKTDLILDKGSVWIMGSDRDPKLHVASDYRASGFIYEKLKGHYAKVGIPGYSLTKKEYEGTKFVGKIHVGYFETPDQLKEMVALLLNDTNA